VESKRNDNFIDNPAKIDRVPKQKKIGGGVTGALCVIGFAIFAVLGLTEGDYWFSFVALTGSVLSLSGVLSLIFDKNRSSIRFLASGGIVSLLLIAVSLFSQMEANVQIVVPLFMIPVILIIIAIVLLSSLPVRSLFSVWIVGLVAAMTLAMVVIHATIPEWSYSIGHGGKVAYIKGSHYWLRPFSMILFLLAWVFQIILVALKAVKNGTGSLTHKTV
jgi:hypothetical protein